jgi:hypothetical protein
MANHEKRDWLPHGEQSFFELCQVWSNCLTDEQWYAGFGWDEAEVQEVTDAIAEFILAYRNYQNDNSTANRVIKDTAMKKAMGKIRVFARTSVRNNPKISVKKKLDLIGTVPDDEPSPVGEPTEMVEFFFKFKNFRELQVHFRIEGATNRAKPYGCNGAVICWVIGDAPATTVKELVEDALATRTPRLFKFTDEMRGRTLSVAMCWQNETGARGPWSEIQSIVIP